MSKKKRRQTEEEQMENYFDVFIRNYRNVPGFRSLIKLILYFLFIGIFILVIALSSEENESTPQTTTTTTTQMVEEITKTYKDILEETYKIDLNIKADIVINTSKYIIEATNVDNELSGYYETDETTKRFKISNSKIYELKLDNAIENPELFNDITLDFIIPANLINILKSSLSTKRIVDEETIYTYDLEYNNISYKVNTYVIDEKLTKIEINNNAENYVIVYTQEEL